MAFETEQTQPPTGKTAPCDDLIVSFLAAMETREVGRLVEHLGRQAVWSVRGRPMLTGRNALHAFWTKLVARYSVLRVEPRRLVIDGSLRLTDQVHIFMRDGDPPFAIENVSIYRVEDSRIVSWNDHFDLRSAPAEEAAVWRRLRDVASVY